MNNINDHDTAQSASSSVRPLVYVSMSSPPAQGGDQHSSRFANFREVNGASSGDAPSVIPNTDQRRSGEYGHTRGIEITT